MDGTFRKKPIFFNILFYTGTSKKYQIATPESAKKVVEYYTTDNEDHINLWPIVEEVKVRYTLLFFSSSTNKGCQNFQTYFRYLSLPILPIPFLFAEGVSLSWVVVFAWEISQGTMTFVACEWILWTNIFVNVTIFGCFQVSPTSLPRPLPPFFWFYEGIGRCATDASNQILISDEFLLRITANTMLGSLCCIIFCPLLSLFFLYKLYSKRVYLWKKTPF